MHERQRLSLAVDEGPFYYGKGCAACGRTGFAGRIGIFELFVPDEEMADLIAAETPIHRIKGRAIKSGMRSLFDEGMQKARAGIVPLSEVLRVIPYRMMVTETHRRK